MFRPYGHMAETYRSLHLYMKQYNKLEINSPVQGNERFVLQKNAEYTWCGYKITGLMLEHLLLKKIHNRNVVTLNVLPSAIPTPLHANLPLLEAMLQVVF